MKEKVICLKCPLSKCISPCPFEREEDYFNEYIINSDNISKKDICLQCPLADCVEPCPFECDKNFDEDLDEYILDINEFKKSGKNKGWDWGCEESVKSYFKAYYLRNREKAIAYAKEYYWKHKDKIRIYKAEYYLKNKEKINTHKKIYYLKKKMAKSAE